LLLARQKGRAAGHMAPGRGFPICAPKHKAPPRGFKDVIPSSTSCASLDTNPGLRAPATDPATHRARTVSLGAPKLGARATSFLSSCSTPETSCPRPQTKRPLRIAPQVAIEGRESLVELPFAPSFDIPTREEGLRVEGYGTGHHPHMSHQKRFSDRCQIAAFAVQRFPPVTSCPDPGWYFPQGSETLAIPQFPTDYRYLGPIASEKKGGLLQ